jgi:hypothetical protein
MERAGQLAQTRLLNAMRTNSKGFPYFFIEVENQSRLCYTNLDI